ncbi:dihydrodipicolinate synthase family protein [Glaciecola siphonariae]|uniref:Dihydrodipicolinate synthase family protein n=1 Tax=Glaciecola siphonariae TaxID=521012 RepID=A0ABV9M0X3_9ALTE
MIFSGLSGFPITPIKDGRADIDTLSAIVRHVDASGLDSIGVLGSTGSFAYLNQLERERVMACWSKATTPWIGGVSATSSHEALLNCQLAHKHGAKGVIANAFAYVPLRNNELTKYFLDIAEHSPLPVCVYDNPVTTGQALSYDVIARLAEHPNIQAIKMFAQQNNQAQHASLSSLNINAGYAVDAFCCDAMIGGASAWYSTLAGTVPELLVPIMNAIKTKDVTKARRLNTALAPLYQLMRTHSGYRVVHALANQRGWQCELPSPLIMPDLGDVSLDAYISSAYQMVCPNDR